MSKIFKDNFSIPFLKKENPMVAVNKNKDNAQAQTQDSQVQQPMMGDTAQQQVNMGTFDASLDDFWASIGGDVGDIAEEGFAKRGAQIIEEINEYKEKNPNVNYKGWNMAVLHHHEIPQSEMVAFWLVVGGKVVLHPVLFAEKGGRTYFENNVGEFNGMMGGQMEGNKTSTATIVYLSGFRQIVASELLKSGVKVETDNLLFAGCTLLQPGRDIEPPRLLANAANEVYAVISAAFHKTHPHNLIKPNANGMLESPLDNKEIHTEVGYQRDATNMHGAPVFAPLVIKAQARQKTTLEGQHGYYNINLGRVAGLMDYLPFSQQSRREQMMINQQRGISQPVPDFKPIFILKDIALSPRDGFKFTPANLFTMLAAVPKIAGAEWIKKVVEAGNNGFASDYDFASIGYDKDGHDGTALTEVHDKKEFTEQAMANMAMNVFDGIEVRVDIPSAGPNSAALRLMIDTAQKDGNLSNSARILSEATGGAALGGGQELGKSFGLFPSGTYKNEKGEVRDASEMLNYFSWATHFKGDKVQLQKWHQWFCNFDPAHANRYLAERIKMAEEIMPNFELEDTVHRISLSYDVIELIVKSLSARGTTFRTVGKVNVGMNAYGYQGAIGGGIRQEQSGFGVMGGTITGGTIF